MRSVSEFYHGMFDFSSYVLPEVVISKQVITSDTEFNCNLKTFMGDDDFICSKITFNNQLYKNGDIIIVGIEDCDNLNVGLIKTILIKDNKVYFAVQRYQATRNWLQYFECEKPTFDLCEFVESSKIVDFKPVIMRGTTLRFIFTLHHHVSYDYQ
jgi:hypothetical protein